MRQLLRRLAVSAVLAPVAAAGVATMFATPAAAVESKPAPSQPGMWMTGGLPQTGTWLLDPSQAGSWIPGGQPATQQGAWTPAGQQGSWTPGSQAGQPGSQSGSWKWKHGSRKPSPWTPGTSAPAPTSPTTPAPTTSTPAPTKPATPAPATTTPAAGSSKEQTLQTEINRLIDTQRTSNGCAVLTVNDQLTTAARTHSQWMAQTGTFSHTGNGGSNFVARAKAAGYAQPSAENIAMGYRTAAQVVDGWMNSAGHRANIVNCKSKTVGLGVAFAADGSPYYTQVFGY